jgi:PIN domain nuclease of toxin-antitoxin system
MKALLDTHAVLWWQAGGKRLSRAATRVINNADELLISPLTCWEIATLERLGRIKLDRDAVSWVRALLRADRIAVAPLTSEAGAWAGELPDTFPGDPIDRLLYATARDHRVPLVSKDQRLRAFARAAREVDVIW